MLVFSSLHPSWSTFEMLVLHQSCCAAETVLTGRLGTFSIVQQLHTPIPFKLLHKYDLALLICFHLFYQLAQPYSVVRLHCIIIAWPFKIIHTVHSFRFLCYSCTSFKWFSYIYITFICWQYRSLVSFSFLCVWGKKLLLILFLHLQKCAVLFTSILSSILFFFVGIQLELFWTHFQLFWAVLFLLAKWK